MKGQLYYRTKTLAMFMTMMHIHKLDSFFFSCEGREKT